MTRTREKRQAGELEDGGKPNKGAIFIRGIDPQTKYLFKLYCLKKGMSMTKVIERYMRKMAAKEAEGGE